MRVLLLKIELFLIVKDFIGMMPLNNTFKNILLSLDCSKLQFFLVKLGLQILNFIFAFIFVSFKTIEFEQVSLFLFLK